VWKISEEEICSDHKIIQFYIGQYIDQQTGNNFHCIKYIIRAENLKKFEALVTQEKQNICAGPAGKKANKALDKYILHELLTQKTWKTWSTNSVLL
jgi:hypothetical protein